MKKPKLRIEKRLAVNGQFFWHAEHRNGNITATCGETYTRKEKLSRSLVSFLQAIKDGDYEVVDATKGLK